MPISTKGPTEWPATNVDHREVKETELKVVALNGLIVTCTEQI